MFGIGAGDARGAEKIEAELRRIFSGGVGEAAAKPTAGALHVDGDVVVRNVENFCDELAAGFGRLARGPEFELAVVKVGEAIFGLHGSMREERIRVGGFDNLGGGLQSFGGVAVAANGNGGWLLG